MFKHLLIIALVILGCVLTEGFTSDLGGFILLIAGLWGGKLEGRKEGIRAAFAGKTRFDK